MEHSNGQPNSPLANTGRQRRPSLPPQAPSKRLILCEDGSWLNSDSGNLKRSLDTPSNITRLSRAIKSQSRDGIPQVVYYHYGVGAGGGLIDKLIGGVTGAGLAEITREGYQFIATNWIPGDEIFVFGFSRGAYTARAIAGLIDEIGVLTREGLPFLQEIFRDVQHQHDDDYRPRHPDIPFKNKPSARDPKYKDELQRRRLTNLHVPIKVVGVFDTVGSLGTPKIGWLQRLGLQSNATRELSFYDTSLGNCIEYAFQAIALDETRFAFQPTLWEKFEDNRTVLRQVWFPGAHGNIGGGYDDQQLATISLAWMMAQCQPFLDFDVDYLLDQWEAVEDFYKKHEQKVRPWSFGRIRDGQAGIYALGGSKVRSPGRYCAVDPTNGKQTKEPLRDTHEYIHPSARARIKFGGPGISDRGQYECKALDDWNLMIEGREDGGKWPDVFWRSRYKPEDGFCKILPEAPLKDLETELLQYDAETRDYVLRPSGVRRRRSTRSQGRRTGPPSPDD